MGFELTAIDYDSSRALNPMSKMKDTQDANGNYMYNRIPYMFTFMLYLGTRKFEDSLKIIEQIVPFFTPELNVSIKDKGDFGIITDVPFILNNSGFTIDWQGGFENRRTVLWTLDFSAKAYLYSNVREQQRIKETILTMENEDFNRVYETLTSTVEPRSAQKVDPHIIIDRIIDGSREKHFTFNMMTGVYSQFNMNSDIEYTCFDLTSMINGQSGKIVDQIKNGPLPTFSKFEANTGQTLIPNL